MKAPQSFETLVTTHPTTQRHTSEDLNCHVTVLYEIMHGDSLLHVSICCKYLATHVLLLLLLLLLLEALQLQRSFGLLSEFLPFGPVSDAFLPVCYFHPYYVNNVMMFHVPIYKLSVLFRDTCRGLHPFINPEFSYR